MFRFSGPQLEEIENIRLDLKILSEQCFRVECTPEDYRSALKDLIQTLEKLKEEI